MVELAHLVRDVTGCAVSVTYQPLPEDDPARRRPDITRARETLGWEPQVPLLEGLERTVAWFRDRLRP